MRRVLIALAMLAALAIAAVAWNPYLLVRADFARQRIVAGLSQHALEAAGFRWVYAEREADAAAVRVLRAAGISPAAMVTLFDRLAEKRSASEARDKKDQAEKADPKPKGEDAASWLGIAFASHPADAERVRFFREAAAGR